MMKNKFNAILVAFLAVAGLFTSCSKEDNLAMQTIVGFSGESFAVDIDNEATLKIVSTTALSGGETVAFTIGGNLVKGQDYELSADKFIFASGSKEATVKVKLLKDISDDDVLDFTLNAVSFGSLGLSKARIGITNADVILYSFDKSNYTMTNSVEVTLQLSKISGSFTAEKALVFDVEVDTEHSTAVEGTHFSFAGGKTVNIPAGQNKGTVKLNLIKQEVGKDQIVLRLKQLPIVFKPGNYDKASLVVFGSIYDKLEGSWKYSSFYNQDWWLTMNNYGIDNLDLLPKNNTVQDVLTIDQEGLKVNFTGDLKNYFRNSVLVNKGEVGERMQEDPGFPLVQMLLVNALANVNFSATHINEREAEIGFRVFTHNGKEYLDVTVRDYEPKDFLQATYEFFKNDPYPAMRFNPLRFRFEKVQ